MIKILLCDDDSVFLNKMHSEIDRLVADAGIRARIHACTSWEGIGPLLASCDIAFLDIDFAKRKYTGMNIAQKLRELRPDAIIIFVTNYIEYAPEGYEVQAFRYVLKSQVFDKLPEYLKMAVSKLEASRETMKIQINGELIDIRLSDILYIEAQQHTVLVYVKKDKSGKVIKTYRFYSSLTNVEEQLEPHGFLRVHKSYLVNMMHIKKYQCHEVVLDNETVLRASEKNYAQQKNKYLLWKGR